MMRISRTVFYEARIAFGVISLFGILIPPIIGLITVWQMNDLSEVPSYSALSQNMTLLLTLCVGIATSQVMTIERDEGFDLLRRSMPESFWRLPLMRITGALIMLVISILPTWLIYAVAFDVYDVFTLVKPALPAIVFLLGLSLFISGLTGQSWVTMGLLMGYWFFEYQSQGSSTGILYLFNSVRPNPDVDSNLNQVMLLSVGSLLLMLTIWWYRWRRSRG